MSGIVGKNSGRGSGVVGATPVADESVDSSAYVDGSIDNAHLSDNAAGTDEIADNAVTLAKMAGGTDGQIITYDASGDPVAVGPGTDGQVLTSTGAGSPPAFEAAAAGGIATGSNQACQAWVNFNGKSTPAIRDSYNVSSIDDDGTAKYTINYTSAMANANYSFVGVAFHEGSSFDDTIVVAQDATQSTSTGDIEIHTYRLSNSTGATEAHIIMCQVFGDV